jgi:hypothetical protein
MRAPLVALVAVLMLSGCVSTVDGRAVRGASAAPVDVAPLTEAQLDRVLLTIGELNGIMGSTQMTANDVAEAMTDHSADISDPACVGAIYGAEEPVYEGSGWTAVRDQVAREPSGDNDHWVEQTAVLFGSPDQAKAFVDSSHTTWEQCQADDLTVYDGSDSYVWQIEPVRFDGQLLTQVSEQRDADGWACQHALTAVSNVVVETWACGYTIGDEAATIATEMVDNAAGR